MSQPQLTWEVHEERDFASATTGQVHLSIVDADGPHSHDWRGQAIVFRKEEGETIGHYLDLFEDADCGTGDIVDAMAECERLTTEALKVLGGELL